MLGYSPGAFIAFEKRGSLLSNLVGHGFSLKHLHNVNIQVRKKVNT